METVDALSNLLSGVGHRGRGLPQMLEPSDRLADTYLSILDRRLARLGYTIHRFADDTRVLVDDWETANEVVDFMAEASRTLGLVLSSSKTTVWVKEKLDAHEQAPALALQEYTNQAFSDLEKWIPVDESPYGMEVALIPPERAEALRFAYWQLLQDWGQEFSRSRHEGHRQRGRSLNSHVTPALTALSEHSEGISAKLLDDIIFDDATRLESVCRYVLARHRHGHKTEARNHLGRLATLRRQGPWAKLWLLHLAEQFGPGPRAIPRNVRDWIPDQLLDMHELVRAQAAWTLACRGSLTAERLESVYRRATDVSAPSISAAAAKQNAAAQERGLPQLASSLVSAIRDDGLLNQEAYKWAS